MMKPYYNLPLHQRYLQQLVDQFNSDEAVWRSLEKYRRLRRKLLRRTKKQHKALDFLEFAAARQPDDCIGRAWFEPRRRV
jgi:hypothetical protein